MDKKAQAAFVAKTLARVEARARELRNPNLENWLDEVRGYLTVGKYLGSSLNFEDPKTIRRAQRALARMEAHLDRIMVLQHDAKRTLQIIAAAEAQLVGLLLRTGELTTKSTGPAQQLAVASRVPLLVKIKTEWETLEKICVQAQRRIASAKESLKLQSQMDDNLRWAQHRNPG